jgi:Fic family protein
MMEWLFDHLDHDLAKTLMTQLRDLWTHSSTAIEGNTLTLGETAFVLREGLTISGKPLKDHQEVVGHARAIDLIYDLVQNNTPLTESELFALHRAVQIDQVIDIYKPVGGWKKEPNSTVGVINEKQVVFDFASPKDVPMLMKSWFELYQDLDLALIPEDKNPALMAYVKLHASFVHVHPFFDGNGRLARLIANLPVIKSGLPPIIIPQQHRRQYIDTLAEYHFKTGRIKAGDELLPDMEALDPFIAFCEQAWEESLQVVENVRQKQRDRDKEKQ